MESGFWQKHSGECLLRSRDAKEAVTGAQSESEWLRGQQGVGEGVVWTGS